MATPKVWSIPAGVPFLPVLADAFLKNRLVDGFDASGTEIAAATIYVPTRRAARSLRGIFVERMGGKATILPSIRPLGEFDEEAGLFDAASPAALEMPPPVDVHERLFTLARMIRSWKSRLPGHIAALFEEELVVPASTADAIWLARDLAALIDEVETDGISWAALSGLVPDDLARWWQVTLEFLTIVTRSWPEVLAERGRSNPARWRSAQIEAEADRLRNNYGGGPVIAAGSTGSIPATAKLLSAIAHHPNGAVVLPGLDKQMDENAWSLIGQSDAAPSVFGHPQFGLKKLLGIIGAERDAVVELGRQDQDAAARTWLVNETLRPAETTDTWFSNSHHVDAAINAGALDGITLIEAANEREEALAIAIALRKAVSGPGLRAALVTGDRNLARRVSAELLRFGIVADDSGGRPLASTPPASLLRLIAEVIFRPGDPAVLLDLLAHPLLTCGMERTAARYSASLAELVLLRGAAGRPDIADIAAEFDKRLAELIQSTHSPVWLERIGEAEADDIRSMLTALNEAVAPLSALRGRSGLDLSDVLVLLVRVLEAVGRDKTGSLSGLYQGDAGESLASLLRSLIASEQPIICHASEIPDVLNALIASEIVKPSASGDGRIAIWGVLEARLQSADTMVIGGLNEGSWPRKAETGRFMSRVLSADMGLEPPERRTGQAAHDFQMAMGATNVVLARAARADGSPASPSRWLQRLLTVSGDAAAQRIRDRGARHLELARTIDETGKTDKIEQPCPVPPLRARPRRFSVTEIETLRRDPYAVYARRILKLEPLDPLSRDPGAAERGSLFHEILHKFTVSHPDPSAPDAIKKLLVIAADCFADVKLPADVHAVWWPRFVEMAPNLLQWEMEQSLGIREKHAEIAARRTAIGSTGVELSGRADRIDICDGGNRAEILDYKTGSFPSKAQAHTLLSPQMALEGALLAHGAFSGIGAVEPVDLKFVRLGSRGSVKSESILSYKSSTRTARELADDAWSRLEALIAHYANESNGYRSRALPVREHNMDGDYDHLARALEWSSGAGSDDGGGAE